MSKSKTTYDKKAFAKIPDSVACLLKVSLQKSTVRLSSIANDMMQTSENLEYTMNMTGKEIEKLTSVLETAKEMLQLYKKEPWDLPDTFEKCSKKCPKPFVDTAK